MVEIWGRNNCSWCTAAKNLCEKMGYEYNYNTLNTAEEHIDLADRMGADFKTVPQIFMDDRYIGGYEELFQKFNSIAKERKDG